MPDLLLVFLAAAWLNELVIAVGLATSSAARRAAASLGAAVGVTLLMAAALGGPPANFLRALAFSSVLLQLASGRQQAARLQGALQRLRFALPLLAGAFAVLAVIASGALVARPQARETILLCLGLPVVIALLAPFAMALLDRLQLTTTPALLRGTPIIVLSSALIAVGLAGVGRVLPW